MRIRIVTLFPEFFDGPLQAGLLGRAQDAEKLAVTLHNPRDKATDRHRTVDDRPYGGGPGMVMLLEPLAATLRELGHASPGRAQPGRLLVMSPKGRLLNQALARELAADLARGDALTIVCGRYEGFDGRLDDLFPTEHVSIGDVVLNGGETAALAVIEAAARLVPGFMGHAESGEEESFSQSLLEYPQYTRPEVFEGLAVPEILRSGDHGRIAAWRRQESLAATARLRPDLLQSAPLTVDDADFLRHFPREHTAKNLFCALVHYPVLDKEKKSVAVSLTNLDIHDIARCSQTYGLGGYYVTTPLEDQEHLLKSLLEHWQTGAGARSNADRAQAFSLVRPAKSVEEAVKDITERTGKRPLLITTSASGHGSATFDGVRALMREQPVLLLFGTGQGLSPHLTAQCDAMLPPVARFSGYNHLSVRSAVAIVLDRIVGDW
ncbi:tRNA (guanine-N(1)-)-methyltransferase [uncultured delta proteobacterium]|uniref:tRNA (guanine-N(1)-)-methyltransferase n=1 Tax=uncultured delta proteobacterium TaxID=34034 RepID=A0A212J5M1_9DELT|nr:tRNA (guanine-N(1)-)-methyltransferase [uncultured delta proteobacterium]